MLTFLENSLWDVDRCILRVYTIAPIHSSIYNTVQIVDSCQSRARSEFVSGYMSDSEEGFNMFQYGHLEVLMATGSVSLGDVWMLCSEKLRWTLGAWLSFLNALSSTYTMAAPCGDRKQFGNRCGLTIRRSKIQFLVWDSELRLAIMCFIDNIYIYMFSSYVLCTVSDLLWLFSFEGILAYELMAGHPPFEFFGCNMFLQNLHSPSISPHPRSSHPMQIYQKVLFF